VSGSREPLFATSPEEGVRLADGAPSLPEPTLAAWQGSERFSRDASRFGGAVAVTTLLGVIQVFAMPKLLDVPTFGAYRIFLVYFGYAGLLHAGIADGALLRWAGRPLAAVRVEWRVVLRWILALQLAAIVIATAAAILITDPTIAWVIAGLGLAAAAVNVWSISTYALQAAGDFRWAGLLTIWPPLFFLLSVASVPAGYRTLPVVLALYAASQATAAGAAALRVRRGSGAETLVGPTIPPRARELLRLGTPVLFANFAAGLAQSADRVLVSIFTSVTRFALYGFASSALVAANAATQALARVALPHAVRRPAEGRAAFLDGFYDVITVGAGAGLLAYPTFEWVVARFLPAYIPGLPIVRALVVSAIFWIALNVVVVTTLQAFAAVRTQLAIQLVAAALVAIAAGVTLAATDDLAAVAWATAGASAAAWVVGVSITRRRVPHASLAPAMTFAWRTAVQAIVMLAALTIAAQPLARTAIVLVGIAPTLLHAALRLLRRRHAGA
jgi:O-antigen/teichoic acid export membrane protein